MGSDATYPFKAAPTGVVPDFWTKPRNISVVVDNESWILPFAERLVREIRQGGDEALLARTHDQIQPGAVAFFLGCTRITPSEVMARNRRNLVVHESALPDGRGFSPLTWQIIAGKNEIPITLFEMSDGVDEGPIVYQDTMRFSGHELLDELRSIQGEGTIRLCLWYLAEERPPAAVLQSGTPSYYRRRKPEDSRIDPNMSLASQFNLLRTVDNEKYPAFFEINGHRYKLAIEKVKER